MSTNYTCKPKSYIYTRAHTHTQLKVIFRNMLPIKRNGRELLYPAITRQAFPASHTHSPCQCRLLTLQYVTSITFALFVSSKHRTAKSDENRLSTKALLLFIIFAKHFLTCAIKELESVLQIFYNWFLWYSASFNGLGIHLFHIQIYCRKTRWHYITHCEIQKHFRLISLNIERIIINAVPSS
jgi:hypothetical protein